MRKTLIAAALTLAVGMWAQQPPKQPAPKSQKELDAILAIQNAPDAAARVKAAEDLLVNFADTEFKEFALQMQTFSYQELNDFDKMMISGERALEINPDNVAVLVAMAQAIPQRTREHDLDKDEKLGKAEKFARKAQALIPNLTKFNPQITDEQWAGYKRGAMSQSHEALGLIFFTRKDYAGAEKSFKTAVEVSPQPDPATFYRLAMTYSVQNKFDEAIQALDQSIANGGLKVGDKDLAAEQKAAVMKAKAAASAAKPPAPAATPAPPPVEIKRP
jgi:tetratricopeptide (TPR) repeat protein